MKSWKFIISVTMAIVIILVLGFGVYASIIGFKGVNNTTDFNMATENVFVRIKGEYTGPESSDAGASSTYFYEINRNSEGAYDDLAKSIPGWKIGSTNFTRNENVMMIDFEFTNLNEEKSLKIDISKIAIDSENKFKTEFVNSAHQSDIIQDNYTAVDQLGQISNIIVEPNVTMYVRIVWTLISFDQTFTYQNNIQVSLFSI